MYALGRQEEAALRNNNFKAVFSNFFKKNVALIHIPARPDAAGW